MDAYFDRLLHWNANNGSIAETHQFIPQGWDCVQTEFAGLSNLSIC
ncbi:hypothetical protein T09_13625 [Trichinella sp. T9]|nr:hypothetical protein T09_13625 [Trichinella sp. T9]